MDRIIYNKLARMAHCFISLYEVDFGKKGKWEDPIDLLQIVEETMKNTKFDFNFDLSAPPDRFPFGYPELVSIKEVLRPIGRGYKLSDDENTVVDRLLLTLKVYAMYLNGKDHSVINSLLRVVPKTTKDLAMRKEIDRLVIDAKYIGKAASLYREFPRLPPKGSAK